MAAVTLARVGRAGWGGSGAPASRRIRGASCAALLAGTAGLLAVAGTAAAAPSKVESQLRPAKAPKRELSQIDRIVLPGGTRLYRFEQEVGGVDVLDTGAVVSDPPGRPPPQLAADQTRQVIAAPGTPQVPRAQAIRTASRAVGLRRLHGTRSARLAIEPGEGGTLVWQVKIPASSPLGDFDVLVDARSGQVVRKLDVIRDFRTGHAKLFNPNPVVERVRSGSLAGLTSDHHDRNTPLLTRLRRKVRLTDIDPGQHCLRGRWARVKSGPRGGHNVCAHMLRWGHVKRADDRFEALMAYYHITRAQKYIHSLGFSDRNQPPNGINDHSQPVDTDAFGIDNSFFEPFNHEIRYGTGGVDDAEDADVILHEYGHALQFAEDPAFLESGGQDAGALQEGSADYWAAVMSSLSPHTANEDDVCIFDWDSVSYGRKFPAVAPYKVGRYCGRRADKPLTFTVQYARNHCPIDPSTGKPDVHCVGEVWSSALWDLRNAIGAFAMDQIYLTAQLLYHGNERFDGKDGAGAALVQADADLYGHGGPGPHQSTICTELNARGILAPPTC